MTSTHTAILAAAAMLAAVSGAIGQTISSLSEAASPRSGRLVIEGKGFGEGLRAGTVLIDDEPAIVTRWHDGVIHAYVPEAASYGPTDVLVVTPSGTSNAVPLEVTPRSIPRDHHRLLWSFQTDDYSLGRRIDVGPDGTLYTSDGAGLYALSPDGALLWFTPGVGGGRPVTFGADGTIYTGSDLISALEPDGTIKWVFENPRPGLDLAAGPNVGPDGNIYAAQDTDGDPNALGVFAVDADGNLLWSTGMEYPMISLRGPSFTDIVFDTDRMYITVYRRTSRPPTVRTYNYDGDLLWYSGDLGLAIGGPPALHPSGKLIANWAQTGVQALNRDGDVLWIQTHPADGQLLLAPVVGPDENILVADWSGPDFWAFDHEGNTQWLGPQPGYDLMSGVAVSPDNTQIVASGADTFGLSGWVRGYVNGTGELKWQVDLADDNGLIQLPGSPGKFSPDSGTHYFATYLAGDATYGYVHAVDTSLTLDCDGDGVLDIDDNCVCTYNPDQADSDGDGLGDACDPFILPDDCVDALPICPGVTQGNTIGATNDGRSSCSPNSDINKDIWYAYTPAISGTATIDGRDSLYSFYLSAHSGCPGTVQNEVACDFDSYNGWWPSMTFDVTAGQTYYIRVNGFNAVEMTSFQLTLTGPDCGSPCPGDFNNDGVANTLDVLEFLNAWNNGDPRGDFNGDGAVNTLDVLSFLNAWSAGC